MRDGRMAEHRHVVDMLERMQQLALTPELMRAHSERAWDAP
ncbi:MAG: hypothetical protein ABR525_05350 [Candidatus Limnocylindria bacterium]